MRAISIGFALFMPLTVPGRAVSTTLFFDDLSGSTSGSTTGTNSVSFTPSTAVFSTPQDGIAYSGSLFPAEGVIEVRLRVDSVGAIKPNEPTDFGAIVDSAGADARTPGDLFLVVRESGLVQFTLSTGPILPLTEVQVTSSSSIIDGDFHVVGIKYGSEGIELRIDGIVEATDSYARTRNSGNVSLGDFTEQQLNDVDHAFSFLGEVDWIRSGTTFSVIPEPSTAVLLGGGLLVLGIARKRHAI